MQTDYGKNPRSYKKNGVTFIPVWLDFFDENGEPKLNIKNAISSDTEVVYIYEDFYKRNKTLAKERVRCALGSFKKIFARKCKIVSNFAIGAENRIEKSKVEKFLERRHHLGYIKQPYCVALIYQGVMVAAATFSKPRMMAGKRSFEWTRYASLPGVKVLGGMGKILKYFTAKVANSLPVEIMSYSDNEMGKGNTYRILGFTKTAEMPPIKYYVDLETYKRLTLREFEAVKSAPNFRAENYKCISNVGSTKWIFTYNTSQ